MEVQRDEPISQPPAPGKDFAITSLVLGLVGLIVPPCSLLAIIFGGIALNRIKHGTGEGKGMAVWGVALGIIRILLYAFYYGLNYIFEGSIPIPG